jgi:hypothetical protein
MMALAHTNADELRRSITREACKAIGFKPKSWQEQLFSAIFRLPAGRFANLAAEFDNRIAQEGVSNAMRWLLPRFARQVTVQGAENIPATGPLMLVSNHPGAFDGVVILAQMPRDDIKIIVSDVPFTRGMQAASRHMIYSTGEDMHERMNALRQSVRHLRNDGALMLFPTGLVDPDPSFMPGAAQALEGWSDSLEFFLRQAPETQLLPVIVSGVIAPKYLNNPLARRQKTVRSRQKAAEYMEVAQLMVLHTELGLTPRVSFGKPLGLAGLQGEAGVMPEIIRQAGLLLEDHLNTNSYDK